MPQIISKTRDPFAVTALFHWCESVDIESVDISEPDDQDVVTVTLFGMPTEDERFSAFAERVKDWIPVDPRSRRLDRIIAEPHDSMWMAYFEEVPGVFFYAGAPSKAVAILLDDYGIPMDRVTSSEGTPTRMVFKVSMPSIPCPECRGSGKYVGFTVTEDCRRCAGAGTI